jgi:hypothetical protein
LEIRQVASVKIRKEDRITHISMPLRLMLDMARKLEADQGHTKELVADVASSSQKTA